MNQYFTRWHINLSVSVFVSTDAGLSTAMGMPLLLWGLLLTWSILGSLGSLWQLGHQGREPPWEGGQVQHAKYLCKKVACLPHWKDEARGFHAAKKGVYSGRMQRPRRVLLDSGWLYHKSTNRTIKVFDVQRKLCFIRLQKTQTLPHSPLCPTVGWNCSFHTQLSFFMDALLL